MNLDMIAELVATCLILHNMSVHDRVMGEGSTYYDPQFGTAGQVGIAGVASDATNQFTVLLVLKVSPFWSAP
jgi:hypothetical protein